MLGLMQHCTRTKSEELMEVVPEALKNMLLVMAAKDVLVPTWQVSLVLRSLIDLNPAISREAAQR